MSQFVAIKTGGQQFLVKQGDEIIVNKIDKEPKSKLEFDLLAKFDTENGNIELGNPLLKTKVKGELLEQIKGDKIRVSRFKAKVRYRKVKGFRAQLTKAKIIKI